MALDTSQSPQTLVKAFLSAPCLHCKKSIALRQDGCLRTHGPTEAHCPGSGSDARGARPTADTHSTPTDNTQSSAPSSNPPLLFSTPRGKILKRIPRGARDAMAEQLSHIIDTVLISPEVHANWTALFAFPACCLAQPSEGGRKCRNLTTAVVKQTQRFKEVGVAALDQQTVFERGHRKRVPLSPDAAAAKRAAAKLDEGDIKGAIRLLCSTDTIAEASPATLQ